jgi:hypothetical protein
MFAVSCSIGLVGESGFADRPATEPFGYCIFIEPLDSLLCCSCVSVVVFHHHHHLHHLHHHHLHLHLHLFIDCFPILTPLRLFFFFFFFFFFLLLLFLLLLLLLLLFLRTILLLAFIKRGWAVTNRSRDGVCRSR